jgi:hypothetical protein
MRRMSWRTISITGGLVFLLSFAYDVPFNSTGWGYNEGYVIDAALRSRRDSSGSRDRSPS